MRLLYKTGPMESLRKWFYKPRRDDRSLLAQFFFADDALNMIAAELDSFDGRKDPERCSTLVNQLRHAQDRVLNITSQIMDQVLGDERVARGFRVKFPEDVLQDNLAGQLWFGAECLAAGSSIMNREEESAAMRPLAKALTRSLETVRSLLREQCLRPRGLALQDHDDMLHESLRIFDRLFAEFELCYVSAMVNVKTPHEFEAQQLICVLFSESLRRALKQNLLTQEQVDSYDPALMFAVPRLAIVSGLLIYSSGPLSIDKLPEEMSDMFRPFRTLLHKIRSLLWTLDRRELLALERFLCTNEDVSNLAGFEIPPADDSAQDSCYPDIGEFVSKFYADHAHCRDLYTTQSSSEPTISDGDYLPDNIEVMTPIIDGLKRLSEDNDESERESEVDDKQTDSASTDTFQTSDSFERATKTSTENRDARDITENDSDLARTTKISRDNVEEDNVISDIERMLRFLENSRGDKKNKENDPDVDGEVREYDAVSELESMIKLLEDCRGNREIKENDPDVNRTRKISRENRDVRDYREELFDADRIRKISRDNREIRENDSDYDRIRKISRDNRDIREFREDSDLDRTRKISREVNRESDLSSLRNLSTNGLMMFDPLVINAVSASTSGVEPRQLPDQDLVTSLNEQVTEIVDRLSSIVSDVDIHDIKNHSFSTNDVPTLISNDSNEDFGFTGPRNEQLSCMPSTSHGYLIPNAISQEPVVLASLSHNNSAVFNQDEDVDFNRGILNADIMIPSIDADIVNMDMTIASVNLSQLLIAKEELKENCDSVEVDDSSFHTANMTMDKDRVKFILGYESDHDSPADSGVSTENTSLDRSPDTEQNKNIKENHFMQQNRVLKSPVDERIDEKDSKNTLESSFSGVTDDVVDINYVDGDVQKNEAGSSRIDSIDRLNAEGLHQSTSVNSGSVQNWVSNDFDAEIRTIEDAFAEFRRQRETDKKMSSLIEDNNRSNEPNCSQSSSSNRRKTKKNNTKSKKKKKLWSPVGHVILDNRSTQSQNSPLRLNLDHFVDESSASECAGDEQIALALQAQELAARQQARGKFKSSEDLIHRLFVCIAGVADQLQTNFAADLRNILKAVFQMNQTIELPESKAEETLEYQPTEDQVMQNGSSFDSVYSAEEVYADSNSDSTVSESNSRLIRRNTVNSTTIAEQAAPDDARRKSVDNSGNLQASVSTGDLTYTREERSQPNRTEERSVERAPEWVPDIAAPACMRCSAHFTAFRRRHHCRNCGKVFCASCSSNSIPLPRYGQMKPVRVCEECFQTIAQRCRRHTPLHR